MLGDVCESLLNHPVETGPVGIRQSIERRIYVGLDLHSARSRNLLNQPGQGRGQAQIVEHGGAEQHRDVANDAKSLLHDALGVRDPRGKLAPGRG